MAAPGLYKLRRTTQALNSGNGSHTKRQLVRAHPCPESSSWLYHFKRHFSTLAEKATCACRMSVSGPISPQSESKCSVVMSASGHFETQPSTPASPSSPQVKADDGSGIKILAEVAEGAAMACSKSPRRHQVTSPRSRAESRKKRLSGVCKRRRRARKRKSGSGSSKKSGSSQEMQSASRRMQLTVAPNNTTQFLIEDHNDSIDIDMPANPKGREGRRERDSSISVDTDDEYYSSPPDEQEYYLNDFNDAYDDGKSGDLQSQPRNKLMENVVMLEKIVERLTSELAILKNQPLEYLLEPNYRAGLEAAQTRKCQAEISRLQAEINKLRVENECLKKHCYSPAPVYSSSEDSESDSNSSTGSSSSDEELEDDQEKDVLPAITLAAAQEASDESDAE